MDSNTFSKLFCNIDSSGIVKLIGVVDVELDMDSQYWLMILGLGGYGILFIVVCLRCICKVDTREEVNNRCDYTNINL